MSVPNVLANRYASPAMRAIWEPESKIRAERALWLAVLEAQRDLGVDFGGDDPDAVLADYRAVLDLVNLSSIAARERVIRPVVAHAKELLAQRRGTPLPDGVSAHKLRHTFASILYVRGEDPPYVMAQLGHTDAGFTLRVYAHAMRRDEGDKERLKALVEG